MFFCLIIPAIANYKTSFLVCVYVSGELEIDPWYTEQARAHDCETDGLFV